MTRWLLAIASLLVSAHVRAAVVEIDAGPIWNNMDAGGKCPGICAARGAMKWTGDWRTTVMGQASVCSCQFPDAMPLRPSPPVPLAGSSVEVDAGPIWNNMDAANKCPGVCSGRGAVKWTGDWRTTVMGQRSVCTCQLAGPGPDRPSFVAPVAGSNACSVGGTGKCPGCAVSCESGMRPTCTPSIDGFASGFCQRDASCRCLQ